MEYKTFKIIMSSVSSSVKRENDAYHAGIDLTEVTEGYRNAIDYLLEGSFGEGVLDLINWWLFDEEKILKFSGGESFDLTTIEKLWNHIQK